MSMVAPKISVIIPTRHRNESLSACLERLAPEHQALPSSVYEVIVSDDGAVSTAEDLIRQRFPWAKWVAGPRKGPAANRNNGVKHARAEWLAFTDDDCLPGADWLSAFENEMGGEHRVLEGRTVSRSENLGPYYGAPVNERGGFLWSCNFAIKKDFFFKIEQFDSNFPCAHLEDVDFRLRVIDTGEPLRFIPEAVVEHPPRRVGPVLKQALDQEASFYLAAKRGLPLRAIGFSFGALARGRFAGLRRARNVLEGMRFLARSAVEAVLLTVLVPFWLWRYRFGRF
jgi:GT2 family glycosyltransferase